MGRLFQCLRSLQILSRRGVKFKWTSSDSLGEILMPRYLILPVGTECCGCWTAGFLEFSVIGSVIDLDQLME